MPASESQLQALFVTKMEPEQLEQQVLALELALALAQVGQELVQALESQVRRTLVVTELLRESVSELQVQALFVTKRGPERLAQQGLASVRVLVREVEPV